MAGAYYAITSFLTPSAKTTTIRRKPVALSSISIPSPSRLAKRKNYLRLKLLKTLTKPYTTTSPLLPHEPPTNPEIPFDPIETPHEHDLQLPSDQISSDPCPAVAGENERSVELSETSGSVGIAGVLDGSAGKFSTRSVVKFAMYLVGIFVLQTICAVWVLGSADSDQENGNLESESKSRVLELKGMNKGKSLLNGNGNGNIFPGKLGSKPGSFVFIDESELEAKIAEIRAMAREARESEKKEAKTNGLVSEFDDDVSGSSSSRVKSGIEKEVDARLVKLQKRLNSVWEKSPGSLPSYLNKFGKVEDDKDNLDAKEVNGGLMFKKKHKFRSPSTKPRNDPKGFQGLEGNGSISKKEKSISETLDSMARSGSTSNGGLSSLDPKQQIDLRDGDLQESIFGILDEDEGRELPSKESKSLQNAGKNLDKKSGRVKIANAKPSMGNVRKTPHECISYW